MIIDVIHTVGPQGIKPEKLQSCYNTSLKILTEQNLRTIVSIEVSSSNIKWSWHNGVSNTSKE